MDVGGRTLLQRVLDRVRMLQGETLVVATSFDADDDELAAHVTSEHIPVFRGSLHDVGGRAIAAADAFGLERFARVCADRPFVDPGLIARGLRKSIDSGADLVSTTKPADSSDARPSPTVPAGLTTEVIRTDALRELMAETDDPLDREHVTRAFYRFGTRFSHVLLEAGTGAASHPLVIDTEADLQRARRVIEHVGPEPHRASMEVVARALLAVGAIQ